MDEERRLEHGKVIAITDEEFKKIVWDAIKNNKVMCDELVVGDADAQYNDGVSQGRYEAFIEAIEIVKRGGRDEE